MVTPFAGSREASWQAIRDGMCAARRLGQGNPDDGEFGLARGEWIGAPGVRPLVSGERDEPVIDFAIAAAREACDDARIVPVLVPRERFGCVLGTSKVGLRSAATLLRGVDSDEAAAALWRRLLPNWPAAAVAADLGLEGPLHCPVAACATGLASINRGAELILEGACDAVLAGSSDASLVPIVLASYTRLGVLARGFDDPLRACRPFHRARSGFFIGEGAAALVLERAECAAARGARVYAEWLAGGWLADASSLVQLDPEAAGLTRLIGDLLPRAGLAREEVDYVSLHGTATRENDACETRGVRQAFGPHADRLRCSSLKGALGHLLGAAGSVETACTLLAMRDGVLPPTLYLDDPDPCCDLDYTPNHARAGRIDVTLKLSLGFGGHLCAAAFRRIAADCAG